MDGKFFTRQERTPTLSITLTLASVAEDINGSKMFWLLKEGGDSFALRG